MSVSGLSFSDYSLILAHWHYLTHPKIFGCNETKAELSKRSDGAKQIELYESKKNCKIASPSVLYEIDGLGYNKCLCAYRHPQMNTFLLLHQKYEQGILPFQGSLLDQPAQIIEIFSVIDRLKAELKEEQNANQQKNKTT
jgi:hypothetical protein